MYSINKHQVCGRLGKDPELRELENGNKVASFSIATSEKWKDPQGNQKERTEWHNIVVWGKPAEIIAKYVTKGDLLFVEGTSRTRSWEKDSKKFYTTELFVTDFMLMPNGKSGDTAPKNNSNQPPPVNSDDLPF